MKIFPVFIPFLGCPERCIYCQQNYITKSTITCKEQLWKRLEGLSEDLTKFALEHQGRHIETAFYGGSFTLLPQEDQQRLFDFIKPVYRYFSGVRISTRPDGIDRQTLQFCKSNKVTTIELGVQSFAGKVLAAAKRSYNCEKAISSCRMVKEQSFKLGVQLMPGLPGSNSETLQKTISDTIAVKPDFVRIYPTIVLKNTGLEHMYHRGHYKPLTLEESIDICSGMVDRFEENDIKVIKVGLHSDLSDNKDNIVAGPYHPSYGELVAAERFYRSLKKKYILNRMNMCAEEGDDKQIPTLMVSHKAVSLLLGFDNALLKKIKNLFNTSELPLIIDENLTIDDFQLTSEEPRKLW